MNFFFFIIVNKFLIYKTLFLVYNNFENKSNKFQWILQFDLNNAITKTIFLILIYFLKKICFIFYAIILLINLLI